MCFCQLCEIKFIKKYFESRNKVGIAKLCRWREGAARRRRHNFGRLFGSFRLTPLGNRRYPAKNGHRNTVWTAHIPFHLYKQIIIGVKAQMIVKALLIAVMAAFYFAIVPGVWGRISMCSITCSRQNLSKICTLFVRLKFLNSAPLSVWSTLGAYPKQVIALLTKSTVEKPLCSL